MGTVHSGASDAALLIEHVQNQILDRFNSSVTLSRRRAIESVFEAWQSTDEGWKLNADEVAIAEEVKDASIRFIQNLPLGFPQPEVSGEPDGHINLEWYRAPRRVLSVSIGPDSRLYWAALIGTESPRGSARYIERIPEIILIKSLGYSKVINPTDIPPVADNELLARFILNSNEKRDDGNVNHKLFMPYKWTELSVNRHREASIEETWSIGFDIASQRNKLLYGLANIRASNCCHDTLKVVPDPILPNNPNHANIIGYPTSKEDQMAIAKVLAASIEGKWQSPPEKS